jgi:hypothetical protein
MKTIVADKALTAKCGLYCGACSRYLKDKCPGCATNHKASWCTVRKCTTEHGYETCADCRIESIDTCKKYNNFMANVFGFIFNSDRRACIERIRAIGSEAFAKEMTDFGAQSIKRRR